MPTEYEGGRARTERTADEQLEELKRQWRSMSEAERRYIRRILKGDETAVETFEQLMSVHYDRWPVTFDTFLDNEYYAGPGGSSVYDTIRDDLREVFKGRCSEVIMTGGIGWGKSYGSAYGLLYSIYRLTCLSDPQQTYNLAPGTDIYFALLSVTKEQAKLSLLSDLQTKIQESGYFQDLGAECLTDMVRLPKSIKVKAVASSSKKLLSLDVFGGILDEANFGQNRKRSKQNSRNASGVPPTNAERNYKKILTRMKSRFMQRGALPGVMFLVSSKNTDQDFTAKRIAETKDDPSVYVMDYAEWETKPADKYSGETFRVFFGGRSAKSRILEEGEAPPEVADEEARVVEIPVEFRSDFEDNLIESLRDIGGIEVPEVTPYLHRVSAIKAMHQDRPDDPPLRTNEWQSGAETPFIWNRFCRRRDEEVVEGVVESRWEPRVHPDAVRHVHIDPSLSGDATGIAVAHVERIVDVVLRDPASGDRYKEPKPLIYVDCIFRVVAPPNDEIEYQDVRRLIYELAGHGFQIGYVSMDSYQSADSLQQLRERGYETDVRSLDRTIEGYATLKSALYQERVRCYEYPALESELRRLQYHASDEAVDHPEDGSKDLADALAGVVWSLEDRHEGAIDVPAAAPEPDEAHPLDTWYEPGAESDDPRHAGNAGGAGGGGGSINPFG